MEAGAVNPVEVGSPDRLGVSRCRYGAASGGRYPRLQSKLGGQSWRVSPTVAKNKRARQESTTRAGTACRLRTANRHPRCGLSGGPAFAFGRMATFRFGGCGGRRVPQNNPSRSRREPAFVTGGLSRLHARWPK